MSNTYSILLLNGPNLNLLGRRRPELYGSKTLGEIEEECRRYTFDRGHKLSAVQSNHEGVLIDELHAAVSRHHGVVLNPGGYAHTSISLRDAVEAIPLPVMEVHITDIRSRETFRRHSMIEDVATGFVSGRGPGGYVFALERLISLLDGSFLPGQEQRP